MANRVYVPGYGYVTPGESGTGETSRPGWQRPASWNQSSSAPASLNGTQRGVAAAAAATDNDPTNDPVTNPTMPKPTTGVAFPLSGYGGFGEMGGYAYGQRLGVNPDARELFPYGVAYRTEKDAINSFLELDPQYQQWLDNLAENPLIGTSASSGRMLWERISGLAAERTDMGRPASPQQIAAEIANSVGMSPLEGRTKEIDWTGQGSSSSSSYSGGSYGGGGYGGGGGGGGQVSLTNPTSARGLLMQTMQSVLGRNPTENEYSDFIKALNESQMNNPVTVDTSGDTLVQSGGVDPNVLALEYAQGAEDYKSREASKYYNMFMAALGGASGG